MWSVVIIHYSMIIAIIADHIPETCTSMNSINSNQIMKNICIFCFWSEHLQYIHVYGNHLPVMTDTAYLIHIS